MHRTLEYTLLFIIVVVLQVFLFGRLGVSVYVNPLVYIALIILLPMEIAGAALLGLALLLGVTMDFFMGVAGINTIATLFAAFCRPTVLNYMAGKDEVKDGGIPNVAKIGSMKFVRYSLVMIILHSTVFFVLESLTWSYWYYVVLRIVLSSAVCFIVVYFAQKFFAVSRRNIK